MRIIPLERKYILHVADLHRRAFPNFFLTFLGTGFLREFYRSFPGEKNSISYVAVDEPGDMVLGAVVGSAAPDHFFKKLVIRRWWAFGLSSLGALLKNPSIYRRLLRALKYRGDQPENEGYALLSSIAVAPEARGLGVGQALLKTWVEEVRRRQCRGAYLTTDALDNDRINRFYQEAGWKLESIFVTPEGREMNRYIIIFNDQRT